MTDRRTRYFLIAAASVLVAGICTGLVAYYGGLPTGAFSRAQGPAELRFVPREASIVAYANVREVMASQLRQQLRELEPSGDHGRREFEEKTGINVETDIDHVVAAVMPAEPEPGEPRMLLLFRGRFDNTRLEGLARDHGGQATTYKGKRLIEAAEAGRDPAMAFLQPGLIAFGNAAVVRQAIDLEGTGSNVASNDEVMSLVRGIEAGSNAWAVGKFDVLARQARLPEGVASQVPALQWFAASGRVNGGITGLLRAEARDDAAAENLRDVVRGFLALAKLQAGTRPEFQSVLQSLELGGTGRSVALSFSITPELIEAVAPKPRPPANQP